MAYTQDLIDEVKALYPHFPKIIQLAETGSALLGRYLVEEERKSMPIEKILSATSLDELQEAALLIQRKDNLYQKWWDQDPRKR